MATSIIKLDELGSLLSAASNRPFPVQDPKSAWIVESGKLDLFLTGSRNGEPFGPRYPVMRVEQGHAVFGVGGDFDGDVMLMASASPQTTLWWLPQSRLQEADVLGQKDTVLQYLEGWVHGLSIVLSGNIGPRDSRTLDAGETTISDEPTAVVPEGGVLWVQHQKGRSLFLGNPGVPPVDGNHFFPLSKHAWLEAAAKSVLYSIDSRALLQRDPEWQGLQDFHRIAMSCLIQNRHAAEKKEQDRMRARVTADAVLIDSALLQLAAPLRPTSADLQLEEESFADPLFAACQVIGNRLRVKMKLPEDMRRKVKAKDPVASIARASGVRMRRVALRGTWWTRDSGPMLAFRDSDKRPVALLPRSRGRYELYDPIDRRAVMVEPEAAQALNPFAYVFYRPFPAKKLTVWDLLRFGIQDCPSEIIVIVLMGIAGGLLGIATPYATGVIFDSVIPGAERNQLVLLSLLLLMAAISSAMFALTRSFATLGLEGKMDAAVQAAVWDRLLSLPVPFFREYSSGDLAMRSLGIVQIRRTLTGSTFTSILSGIFSTFSLALLFYYSWRLALLACGLVAIAFLVSVAVGSFQVRYQRQIFKLRGRISGLILQLVIGIAKLRMAGAENRAFGSWTREFSQQKERALQSRRLSNALTVFISVFPIVGLMSIFYYNAYIMAQPGAKPLTTGEFLAFLAAFTQFMTAALMMSSSVISVLNIVPLYERAQPIFHTLPEVSAAKSSPGNLKGDIEISHVTFRYKSNTPPVLRDASMRIEPGRFVAFVGPSGSGKSTVFRLLLGFETPESGAIYYDGQDLAGLDVQEVRRQMGVVLQNGRLVNADIFTNIVGSAPLTMEDAWEAAELAGMEPDIRSMPMGMHTVIGEGGGSLSGGQRQRLMIARAIVGKPRVILFDEATSALDNQTQAIVSRSLERLQATRIVIAHRLSTVINADCIFVMDKGVLVQHGTFQELMDKGGMFRELAKRQLT
jgi:NHLM bacteriocin system ABC transporter ATP-binding protein